jgi:hypothetical protein
MEKEKPREQEDISTEEAFRSLSRFFTWMEGKVVPHSEFREHMNKSRVEFLRGIRSLIDKKIGDLEKKESEGPRKRATRVKVE